MKKLLSIGLAAVLAVSTFVMGVSAADEPKVTITPEESFTVEYKDVKSPWIAVYKHIEGESDPSQGGKTPSYQYAYVDMNSSGTVEFNKPSETDKHKIVGEDNGQVGFVWYNGPNDTYPGLAPLPVGTYDVVALGTSSSDWYSNPKVLMTVEVVEKKPEPTEAPKPDDDKKPEPPKTGDVLAVSAVVMAVAAGAALVISKKRK